MKQLTITFLAIGAVLVLWASGVGLSTYLSEEPTRRYLGENHAAIAKGEVPARGNLPSVDTKNLEKTFIDNPDSLEASISFANSLFEEGISEGKAESLKRAVGLYHEILEKSPEQPDALLGLGTLSLHVGVSEKAIEYYERYLAVQPDDKAIIANLALAEGRSGKEEQALGRLSAILSEEPDFVIGLVTKGLILSEQGSVDDAVKLWVKAESLEKSETLKGRISGLILDALKRNNGEAPKSIQEKNSLEDFFKYHEIVGPKYGKSYKGKDDSFVVELNDFPVSAMPPFAKQKFEESIKQALEKSPYRVLVLVDAVSKEELLKVAL